MGHKFIQDALFRQMSMPSKTHPLRCGVYILYTYKGLRLSLNLPGQHIFNQVFQRKDSWRVAAKRIPLLYFSYSFHDRKLMFCRIIKRSLEICMLLGFWLLINQEKYQLLNVIIFSQNIAFRVLYFSGYVVFVGQFRVGKWAMDTVHIKQNLVFFHIDSFSISLSLIKNKRRYFIWSWH